MTKKNKNKNKTTTKNNTTKHRKTLNERERAQHFPSKIHLLKQWCVKGFGCWILKSIKWFESACVLKAGKDALICGKYSCSA